MLLDVQSLTLLLEYNLFNNSIPFAPGNLLPFHPL